MKQPPSGGCFIFRPRSFEQRPPTRNRKLPRVNQDRWLVWLAVIVGIALIVVAVVYWAEPAHALPSWLPGHEAGSNHHHVKHGIAAFLLGVACLVFAWFRSAGPRRATTV